VFVAHEQVCREQAGYVSGEEVGGARDVEG
jgi:hypothetical protein